jgi:hypothetical protein
MIDHSVAIDHALIRSHVMLISELAASSGSKGKLVIASFGENPARRVRLSPKVEHYPIGKIEPMIEAIVRLGREPHRNVYMPLAVVRGDLPDGKKGEEADVVAALAIVGDFDDANASQYETRLPLPPNYVLETSPGRFQTFFLFDGHAPVTEAKPVAIRLKAFAKCDHGTADLSHVWRVPGTPNWPNAKKVTGGRHHLPEPVRVAAAWNGARTSLDALGASLPEAAAADSGEEQRRSAASEKPSDHADARAKSFADLPRWLREAITMGESPNSESDRSDAVFAVACGLIRCGWSDDAIARVLLDPTLGISAHPRAQPKPKWYVQRQVDRAREATGWVIMVQPGGEREAAVSGIAAMHATGQPFYERGARLVRVCPVKARAADGEIVSSPGIVAVTRPILFGAMGQSARWEAPASKGNQPRRISPPDTVVQMVADMIGEWPFPTLAGVIGCPTLRHDGSLLAADGYDLATGLVLLNSASIPAMSECPTRDDAVRALRLIDGLLDEFPFVDGASRSVALSQILTPVMRGAFPVAPMHLATAPSSGTGKSYLADIASAIATGERCAVMSVSPSAEETEKRLIGAALAGFPIIALDNCATLQGEFLCQVTERPMLQLRRLGKSDQIRVANSFTMFCNGNNVEVVADLVRRTLNCRLDANMEDPEKRTFRDNPLARVLRDRGRHIAACLTIGRAYIAAGRPGRLPPLPSYEGWSDTVRSALLWLGLVDPVQTMEDARDADPARAEVAEVFEAWREQLTIGRERQVKEIVEEAEERDERGELVRPRLRGALLLVAERRGFVGAIDAPRLGRWLKRHEGSVCGGHKLTCDRRDRDRPRWKLFGLS